MAKKIGLIGLTLDLYAKVIPSAMKKFTGFQEEIKKQVKKESDVVSFGPVFNKVQLKKAFSRFKDDDIAGLILVLLSYSPSLLTIEFFRKFNKPILIWNTQKLREIKMNFDFNDLIENHGMHGVQDLASVFNRNGIKFNIITGYYKDKPTQMRIRKWAESVK